MHRGLDDASESAATRCSHCPPESLRGAVSTAAKALPSVLHLPGWARGQSNGTQATFRPVPRPLSLSGYSREGLRSQTLPSRSQKRVFKSRSQDTLGLQALRGGCQVARGTGGSGDECHHQAVSAGPATAAQHGVRPNVPSWCLEQASRQHCSLVTNMGLVTIALLQMSGRTRSGRCPRRQGAVVTSPELRPSAHRTAPAGPTARRPPGLPHPVLCLEGARRPPRPPRAECHISWDFTNIVFSPQPGPTAGPRHCVRGRG